MAASTLEDHLTWQKVGEKNRKSADSKPPTQPPIKCPECGSSRIWKNGLRYARSEAGGDIAIQRYICRECGGRFSEDTAFGSRMSSNPTSQQYARPSASYLHPNRHDFNRFSGPSTCQVSVTEAEGTKNLSRQRTRQKRAAGATKKSNIKGKLVEFIWYMKKHGYAESTIRSRAKLLKRLVKLGADPFDPEDIKKAIAKQSWCPGRKSNACDAYATFLKMIGGTWDKPIYQGIPKLPFIPQESEIDQLIAASSQRIACFLQLLKETGIRPGEAWQLEWTDLDAVTRTLRVTPKKGSNPRIFHISAKLAAMLETSPRDYGDRVFSTPNMRLRHHRGSFAGQRKRIAHKLKNPRIQRIMFKTFRHWKGTMEYHRTKDILHVKQLLGHKNIKNTLRYITLAKELFRDQQEYISKVAHDVKEACELVDVGFEFVTGEYNDGGKIFRKPKYDA